MQYELEVVNIRLVKEPSLFSETTVSNARDVVELMRKELLQYDREVMCVLNLKTNGQVINMNIASVGTVNATLISPREIFKSSILSNANSIIILHNHPSGTVTPSKEDLNITGRLAKCSQLLDIPLLDHIIVGGANGKMYSFAENGLMDDIERSSTMSEKRQGYGRKKRGR